MRGRVRDDNGAALVEAPVSVGIILLLAMGVLSLTQVVWTHMDLATTARDTTRYASRAEWDPSATTVTLDRYRTVQQVKDFALKAGSETGLDPNNIIVTVVHEDGSTVSPAPSDLVLRLGDQVTVEIRNRVTNPIYQTAASITNGAAGIFHLGHPFNEDGVDIKAKSTSLVE